MLDDVHAAREYVEAVARRTPLEYSYTFSEMTDTEMYLKLENSQRTGPFKIRGATNHVTTLSDEEKAAGVVIASAGNRAQGVTLAAPRVGVNSKIVMSEYASISKVKATERYGGDVVFYGNDHDEAQIKAHEIEKSEGWIYVHVFDDEYVMAGQGTIDLEIMEGCPDLDTVVVPIGGGDLISGISAAIKEQYPDARVIGVQAEQASSAADSLNKGSIQTVDEVDTTADSTAARKIGDRPFEVIRERVDEVVTVSDEEIAVAPAYLLERPKTLVEGAGVVTFAVFVLQKFGYEEGEVVVPTLCGGNIDMNTPMTVMMRGLVETGQYFKIRTELRDRPGSFGQLIEIIAAEKVNVYAVRYDRTSRKIALNATEVETDLGMRGSDHVESPLEELRGAGYDVEVLD